VPQDCSSEVCALQVGLPEVGLFQVDPAEVRRAKADPAEVGLAEVQARPTSIPSQIWRRSLLFPGPDVGAREDDPIQHGPHAVTSRQDESVLRMFPDEAKHDLLSDLRRGGVEL
jgi:hypothetical protein